MNLPCRKLSLMCRVYLEAMMPHAPCSGTCDCGQQHECECVCHAIEREREDRP